MREFFRVVLWGLVGFAGAGAIVACGILAGEALTPPMIAPGGGVVGTATWDQGFVAASGTWSSDNTQQAFPIQTTEIRCWRDERKCHSALAEITRANMLFVKADRFDVRTWDDKTIVFGTETAPCAAYTYTIDRADRRLTGLRTAKQPPPEGCGDAEQRPVTLALEDGFKTWQGLQKAASARVTPFVWTALAVWLAFILLMLFRRRRAR